MPLRTSHLIQPLSCVPSGLEYWSGQSPQVVRAEISSPRHDRPENLVAPFGFAFLQGLLQLLLAFGCRDTTCTVRRNILVPSVLGSDRRYQSGDFVENHNTCIRRPSYVDRRTACRTEPSTSCAHLWMTRSSQLEQSIAQNLAGCAEATIGRQTTLPCRRSSRLTRWQQNRL